MPKEHLVCSENCGCNYFTTKEYYHHHVLIDEYGDYIEDMEQHYDEGSSEYFCDGCGNTAHWEEIYSDDEPEDIVVSVDDIAIQSQELPYNTPFDVI